MLQLGSGMQTIEGVTVFPDHADPGQYWYLPAHLEIARRPSDDWPQFSFIKYKRAATEHGIEGGGFLMFTVALTLPEAVERKVRAAVPGNARLSAVPFDSGTVECVALNLQGPGGTTATVSDAGTFVAVEQILGSRVPSLFGENNAVFSLTLSPEGATLLEAAFAQGAAPIGVIYALTFTAMQPALDVRITADFERIYNHFSAGLSANVHYVEIAIQAGIEELVQNGAIKIEVTNYNTSSDQQEQETAAIDFFTQQLLQSWFTPTLTPATLQGGMATAPRATGKPENDSPGSDKDKKTTNPPVGPAPGAVIPVIPVTPDRPNPDEDTATRPNADEDTPDNPAHDVVVRFLEEGSNHGINGVFAVGYQAEGIWQDSVVPAGNSNQLHTAFPGAWDGWVSAEVKSLPELTLADAVQLRRHATTGEAVLGSGHRTLDPNLALVEIVLPASDPVSLTVRIPVTKTVVSASSPDALVAAIFPGGQLVLPGISDCRRITGTNNFELIIPGGPGAFETPSGGSQ